MEKTEEKLEVMSRRLRIARASKGWTQIYASKMVDISQSSLSLYEKEHREPKVVVLTKLAQAYGVTLDWLMGLSDDGGPV